ncbi:hypothetical protein [Sorangium sp. So ce426]|uniref:hypothetical protein n=2 Tax=unclassified Sorangium TaxID=2621164 RepID=UPI003F5B4F8B
MEDTVRRMTMSMSSARLTLLAVLSLPAMACANHPDIAGKAVVALDGKTLNYDTGDDGRRFVKTGERWSTGCYLNDSLPDMYLDRARDDDPPISSIALLVKHEDDGGEPLPNVGMYTGDDFYDGFCHVVATIGSDPREVEFSTGDCELQRSLDGHPALLVSALFHVKECDE